VTLIEVGEGSQHYVIIITNKIFNLTNLTMEQLKLEQEKGRGILLPLTPAETLNVLFHCHDALTKEGCCCF
jgi:hypothetical protein